MTPERLKEIEEREAKAAPGPWKLLGVAGTPFEGKDLATAGGKSEADMNFLSHARDDVPLLLAEVKRLRSLIEIGANSIESEAFGGYLCPWCNVGRTTHQDTCPALTPEGEVK